MVDTAKPKNKISKTPKARAAHSVLATFFSGVFFLTLSNFLTKLCGLFLKVPLTNTLGDSGMAYFNLAYAVYKWFYMISTAGLPVAAAVLCAECAAEKDPIIRSASLLRIRRIILSLFSLLGLIGALIIFFASPLFAHLQGAPYAAAAIAATAPALFCICIVSALRGYYQGLSELLPASISQVVEAGAKMGFGLLFAAYATQKGLPLYLIAAYAIGGLGVGSFLGMLIMLAFLPRISKKAGIIAHTRQPKPQTEEHFAKRLWRIAIPVTLAASVLSLSDMLDSMTVIRRLIYGGIDSSEALRLYGNYTALAVPMFNLPPILIYPVTTALIPILTSTFTKANKAEFHAFAKTALSVTMLIAMPCAAGMSALSEPILRLFFRADLAATGAPLLRVLALGIVFLSLLAMSNAILQATGYAKLPVYAMIAGAVVKFIASFILCAIPEINIYGSPISTVLCYAVMAICNLIFVIWKTKANLSVSACIKPALASVVCALCALCVYHLLLPHAAHSIVTLTAIGVAAIVYLLILWGIGGLRELQIFLRTFKK